MAEVLKRFKLYQLRAAITLNAASEDWHVEAGWDAPEPWGPPNDTRLVINDPRDPALGQRAFVKRADPHTNLHADQQAYHAHRIGLGIGEGGKDFVYGEVFPHEINLDHVHGLDFQKGCYVGQEVVSRMEHRGTARNRIVPVLFPDGVVPPEGSAIMADTLPVGRLGSTSQNGQGLALLRLDRVQDAQAKDQTITAGGLICQPLIPDWAQPT